MSKERVVEINCPKCKENKFVRIYDSINGMLSANLVEKLISGELVTVKCDCGQVIKLDYPILYNNMDVLNPLLIQYAPENLERIKEQVLKASEFMKSNIPFNNPMVRETEHEFYEDWDEFIKRIVEINKVL